MSVIVGSRRSSSKAGGSTSPSSSIIFRIIVLALTTIYICLMVATQRHHQSLVHDQSSQPSYSTATNTSVDRHTFVVIDSMKKDVTSKLETLTEEGNANMIGTATSSKLTIGNEVEQSPSNFATNDSDVSATNKEIDNNKAKKQQKKLPPEITKLEELLREDDELREFYVAEISEMRANRLKSMMESNNTTTSTTINGSTTTIITKLWDEEPANLVIPNWMKLYMTWHDEKRQEMKQYDEETNGSGGIGGGSSIGDSKNSDGTGNDDDQQFLKYFTDNRWIIMQCVARIDKNCGGLADRLKIIPYMIRVAYTTKRILLIHWTKPAALENFLLPPVGGFDWRTPKWIAKNMEDSQWYPLKLGDFIQDAVKSRTRIVRTKYQEYSGGQYWYDWVRTTGQQPTPPGADRALDKETYKQLLQNSGRIEATYEQVFHDVWRILFTPSPAIATIIEDELHRMDLVPGNYVSAHLRALYNLKDRPENQKVNWAENALNCASNLLSPSSSSSSSSSPARFFFVSDSFNATYYARRYAQNKSNAVVQTRVPNPNPPLHFDRTPNWKERHVSEFYDTFVDLYLIALGGCVTYNKGGFGHMGWLVGAGNTTCRLRQDAMDRPKIHNKCYWTDGGDGENRRQPKQFFVHHTNDEVGGDKSIFLKPMGDLV